MDTAMNANHEYPTLMTAPEAVRYLRLDIRTKPDGTEHLREMADAIKSLDHLVRRGLIRPCRPGKNRRFLRSELDRFLRESTAGPDAADRGARARVP